MSFVSTILFRLYRWSLRHSGAATSIEYEHTTKVPIKTEYIGQFKTIGTGITPKTRAAGPSGVTFAWGVGGPKNTPRRRRAG